MEGERTITTQLLLARPTSHPEVRDGCGGNEEIRRGRRCAGRWRQECALKCRLQVGNGGDADDLHPFRERDGNARSDQHHFSTAIACRFGEGDPLPP